MEEGGQAKPAPPQLEEEAFLVNQMKSRFE